MRSSRKRSSAELDDSYDPEERSLLDDIRNMWQFANLCQWIYLFGKAVRIPDDVDVELLEAECLRPHSSVLRDVGLALLKFVSSHRGLTLDLFDEYARRQFVTRTPSQNPFGTDEIPTAFNEFDAFTKVRVLQQLTQWAMMNPARIRERMEEQRDVDQASWRIEPYGWDREDRTYFVLDDNRIYRLTESPPPPLPQTQVKSKKKPRKTYRRGSRSSKRHQISHPSAEDLALSNEPEVGEHPKVDDGLGGMKWECVAVTLEEVRQFLQTLQHSRDENEKILRAQIQDHLVPILDQQEESRRKKALQRERDLLNLAKMANAKRSSRIAGRLEQRKREDQEREEERRREAEAAAVQRAEKQRYEMEKERDLRLMSRERRLKDREARRLRYREDIAHMSDESKTEGSQKRSSSRQLQHAIERKKQALLEFGDAEDWVFDCACGVYGRVDDGTHSIACERCNVWQHSKCVGIAVEEADLPEFHFICASCRPRDGAPRLQLQKAVELEPVPLAEGRIQAPYQSSLSKPSLQESDVAGGANPLTLPEQPPGGVRQVHSPGYSKVEESGSKPTHSPLSTTSPLFNGASAPSQVSILSSNTTHNDGPLLPPPSGGVSPIKHAQNIPCDTPSTSRSTGLSILSTPTLPPIAHPHIPTPPVKASLPDGVGQGRLDRSNADFSPEQGP